MPKRIFIVGAGFYGLTLAEQASSLPNVEVIVFEKRNHIGGNAYSYTDTETSIEVHKYGTHIFHTNNLNIWNYVNRFSSFNDYKHKVIVNANAKKYSMPITLDTICSVYEKFMSPKEAYELITFETKEYQNLENTIKNGGGGDLEAFALSQVGKKLYNLLISGYTEKQWGRKPNELPKEIIKRIPVRFNFNSRYFSDKFEGIPSEGYGSLFNKMVSSKKIKVNLNTDYFEVKFKKSKNDLVIYTGPLDKYFNYIYGPLGWRTLDFVFKTENFDDYQGTSVVNYADLSIPYTRIHEFKHLTPERIIKDHTILAYEYSRAAGKDDDPYYPINTEQDRIKLNKYRDLILNEKNVIFGGRLGSYQYLDMHMAIGAALSDYNSKVLDWYKYA
jgi:UDP-galactopyranose mutase